MPRMTSSLNALSSFDGPLGKAADKLPLHDKESGEDRDDRNRESRHEHRPIAAQCIGKAHHADCDGLDTFTFDKGEREDEFVPTRQEREHQGGDQGRQR